MQQYLIVFQLLLALGLIFLILSQAKGAGLSTVFGGEGGIYRTRRGFERILHYVTIFISVLFFLNSLLIVLLG